MQTRRDKLPLTPLNTSACGCRRDFSPARAGSARCVSDSRSLALSAGNDLIDGSGSPPLSRDRPRRAESVPGVHAMRALSQMTSAPTSEVAKLVCVDNRRRVASRRRAIPCRATPRHTIPYRAVPCRNATRRHARDARAAAACHARI